MRIAVTGGDGFIGAATILAGEAADHDMWRFDHADGNDILGDLDALTGADVVIHLAGMLGTSELFLAAEAAVDVNVVGTLRILAWCRDNGAGYVGITMPDSNWANVYQATKLCAKRLATAWHRTYDLPVSHVRAFNAYGERQKHGPGHPKKFLPTFATEAWSGRPLPVWGSGDQTVDCIDVEDLARMLIDACRFGDDEVFDAGTGTAITVNAVAGFVNSVTDNNAGIINWPMRIGEEPETNIVAKGEGWDKLDWHPHLNWNRVREVVEWYKPA